MPRTREVNQGSVDPLRAEIATLRDVLGTLLMWMAQSAASPLSRTDISILLQRLDRGPNA